MCLNTLVRCRDRPSRLLIAAVLHILKQDDLLNGTHSGNRYRYEGNLQNVKHTNSSWQEMCRTVGQETSPARPIQSRSDDRELQTHKRSLTLRYAPMRASTPSAMVLSATVCTDRKFSMDEWMLWSSSEHNILFRIFSYVSLLSCPLSCSSLEMHSSYRKFGLTFALNINCCSGRYTHIPGGIQSDVGPKSCTYNRYNTNTQQHLLQLAVHTHTGRDPVWRGPKYMYL